MFTLSDILIANVYFINQLEICLCKFIICRDKEISFSIIQFRTNSQEMRVIV